MPPRRPHRKTIKHYHRPGDLHELTFSCYKRLPLLTNDDRQRRLARCIDEAGVAEDIQLVAFVFMPEHLHLLVDPWQPQPDIGRYLARVKQPFSKQIKARLVATASPLLSKLTVRERPGKTCFRFWQEGPGYDRNLTQPATILAAIDYLHHNPVRRSLVGRAVEWKWSSARSYVRHPSGERDPDLPTIHTLRPGTLDDGQGN